MHVLASHKSPAQASHGGQRQLQAYSKQLNVLAHTRAQHSCKPPRRVTAASVPQAANMCWLTQEPNTHARPKGKQQVQAHSKQLNTLAHTRAPYPCKPPRRATTASTQPAASMCWLTQEPSTHASHPGKQQMQVHIKQLNVLAHPRARHPCKPQRQATPASTMRAASSILDGSNTMRATNFKCFR